MNFIQRLFGKSDEATETLCPHCERAMEPGHKCAAMSRRFFFGMMAGVAAGGVALLVLPPVVEAAAPTIEVVAADVDVNALIAQMVDRKKWYYYDTIKLAPPREPRSGYLLFQTEVDAPVLVWKREGAA